MDHPSAGPLPYGALLAVLGALSLLLILPGCQSRGVAQETDETFYMALDGTPQTFDPGKMRGAPGGRIAMNIFEGLLMPAQTTEGAERTEDLVRPGVAKSWTISDDGTSYTFHLREDAKWSNGEPVTAGDFEYAWRRVLNPDFDSAYASLFFSIEGAEDYRKKQGEEGSIDDWSEVGIETVDDHTLRVELRNPTPYFLELVAFYTLFPVPRETIEEHGDKWIKPRNIVSNGAYTLEEFRSGRQIVMEKNPQYWDAGNVSIERGVVELFQGQKAIINAYRAGQIHWSGSGLPLAEVSSLVMRPDYVNHPMLGIYYLKINVSDDSSPLSNPKVRRAMSLALNRRSIQKLALKGMYGATKAFVPSNTGGYESTASLEYDLEKARRLLEEAGYPNGEGLPTMTILYNTSKKHRIVATKVQNMWEKTLGVTVKLDNIEWKTYLEQVENLDYEIARAGWIGDYNDPMTFLELWTTGNGNNNTGWSNEEYDRLIEEAKREPDRSERQRILQRAEELLLREGPIIPLVEYSNNMLLSRRVKGFEPHNRNIHLLKDLRLE